MRIKFLLPITFLLLLIGCNQKEEIKTKPIKKQSPEIATQFDVLPAYSISDNIDAIVLELGNTGEEKLFQNQIYSQVEKEDSLYAFSGDYSPPLKTINSTYIDTVGQFNILRNEKLEKRIKEKLKPSYYVYGTKGYTKVNLGEAYFTVDECISNIIAVKLNNYDRNKYGNPLFCSEKPLNLVYGKDYSKELKAIHKFDKTVAAKVDYSNKPNTTKVFANNGSAYFAYEDSFKWSRDFSPSDINFPSRSIYTINKKGKADCIWGKCLDLFGIPCD